MRYRYYRRNKARGEESGGTDTAVGMPLGRRRSLGHGSAECTVEHVEDAPQEVCLHNNGVLSFSTAAPYPMLDEA